MSSHWIYNKKRQGLSSVEKYDMTFNGVHYGYLFYNKNRDSFKMELNPDTPIAIRPSIIFGSVVVRETLKPRDYVPSSTEIYTWICDRSVPSTRQNLGSILSSNALHEYNPWALVKKNNGRSISDNWEIRRCLIPVQCIK